MFVRVKGGARKRLLSSFFFWFFFTMFLSESGYAQGKPAAERKSYLGDGKQVELWS